MAFKDIRKSRKWLSREEIGLLVVVLVILISAFALNNTLAGVLPGGELFFWRWTGARAFLVEKIEPYGPEIAQRVQIIAYNGRFAFSSEYPYALNDPFFIVLLYTPLAFLRELVAFVSPSTASLFGFPLMRGLWMILSEVALIGTVLYSINLAEWEPPRWLFASLIGFGLFGYFSLNALAVGTPAIILTFLYLSILLALRSGQDELAGAFLSLVAYQWEVGGLFFLFIVVFIFANRRWNVLTGFAMSLFLLITVSFLAHPGWGLPYIRAVLSDWYRTPYLNLNSILSVWFPNVWFNLGTVVSLALGTAVIIEWIGAVQSHFRRVVWAASLSLAATPLIGFAIFPSNHVVLIPSLVLILALVWERWSRSRVFMTILILALALLVPFGLYLQTSDVYNRLYSDLLSAVPPIATVIGLYWMRWWVVHSPRTWIDQLGVRR